jgi:hypothetical protein
VPDRTVCIGNGTDHLIGKSGDGGVQSSIGAGVETVAERLGNPIEELGQGVLQTGVGDPLNGEETSIGTLHEATGMVFGICQQPICFDATGRNRFASGCLGGQCPVERGIDPFQVRIGGLLDHAASCSFAPRPHPRRWLGPKALGLERANPSLVTVHSTRKAVSLEYGDILVQASQDAGRRRSLDLIRVSFVTDCPGRGCMAVPISV